MSYQWDIFISYRRIPLVAQWTHRIFAPAIRSWLPQFHQPDPRIFLDVDEDPGLAGVAPGTPWAPALETALKRSRCLVPVLSAEYFDSEWCLAEFSTMLDRQQRTGAVVVLPIRFADGDFYSAEAKALQQITNFERFNTYRRPGQVSQTFTKEIQKFCRLLRPHLLNAPTWDPHWSVRRPSAPESSHVPKPTF
jgi:hypothetical protein